MALRSARLYVLAIFCFLAGGLKAQFVYYPANSSDLLRSTAKDMADLLNKAIPSGTYSIHEYIFPLPQGSIVLQYDTTMPADQQCKIEGGTNNLLFKAAEDNGLCFGIYKYLSDLGFRFYLPGEKWEMIPSLTTPFMVINKLVKGKLKYKSWNISGGHNRWAMDNDSTYGWDIYYGKNGHEWSRYQRRNNMIGGYRFSGHRGDVMTTSYLGALASNPCYVACYDQSRQAGIQSVPDINSLLAQDLWASEITSQHNNYNTIIKSNPILYSNQYHNIRYSNAMIGIEVPDGAHFGNSTSNINCTTGNYNGDPYPNESDQQFMLANHTSEKCLANLPGKNFQCYAYAGHADIPGHSIFIHPEIDVQVVPSAFQFETSTRGLLNRWYNRHPHISEYHYLNIPQWTGEAPLFSLEDLKATWQRIKDKSADGIVVEASPSKFGSLPFLFAGNRFLEDNINVDSSLDELVSNLFPAESGIHIKRLLKYFGDRNVGTTGNFIKDNKYKLPLFLNELNLAILAASSINSPSIVMERLREFKAYMHYLILYYDFITLPGSYSNKSAKAETMCKYLAQTHNLRLVNSYFLIQSLVSNYPVGDSVYNKYNVMNGSAYFNGNMPLITSSAIDSSFTSDLNHYLSIVDNYKLEEVMTIISKIKDAALKPLDSIHTSIGYTNGYQYPNRSEFYFYASGAGSVTIRCNPHFNLPKAMLNITVEAEGRPLDILNDITITNSSNPGNIYILVPSAGIYKLSVVSKFQAATDMTIITKGNLFFKYGPFYGDKVESYRSDTSSFPKYFYVPQGVQKLYFSVNNACQLNTGCISSSQVAAAFRIKDANNTNVPVMVSPADSSLFFIPVPTGSDQQFWKITTMREYNFCFSNISNYEFYAEPSICNNMTITASVKRLNGECHTQLSAIGPAQISGWQVKDGGRSYSYGNLRVVDMPVILSPSALITLQTSGCSVLGKTGEMQGYISGLSACVSPSAVLDGPISAFPNPTSDILNFQKDNQIKELTHITVYDSRGGTVRKYENTKTVNIAALPPGVYIFSCSKGSEISHLKIVKN